MPRQANIHAKVAHGLMLPIATVAIMEIILMDKTVAYTPAVSVGDIFANVALDAPVSCSSSGYQTPCGLAVDGFLLAPGYQWGSYWQGVGAWIRITFDAEPMLTFARLMQRYNQAECSSEVRMTFQGGTQIMMPLDLVTGRSYIDYNGQLWNEMELDDVITSWVHIEITAVYTTTGNGFYEIEFYIGTNPCPPRYTFVSGTCYRYELTEQLTWEAAQETCAAEHANLVGMETPEEKFAITAWMSRCFDLSPSYFWTSGGLSTSNTWQWGTIDFDWFDWEPNQPDIGDAVAWSVGSQQLVSAENTDSKRYICEYRHLGMSPCDPFCGTLTSCQTRTTKDDVEVLECTCPTDACRDIALTFSMNGNVLNIGPIEICHLDIIYLM